MSKKYVLAGAVVAALALTGLGPVAAPASAAVPAGSNSCAIFTVKAKETVKIYLSDSETQPPQTGSELSDAPVLGLLLKGKKGCSDGPSVQGASYTVKGDCVHGTNDFWDPIQFKGRIGWVPTSCT